jgi:hypothetical protein
MLIFLLFSYLCISRTDCPLLVDDDAEDIELGDKFFHIERRFTLPAGTPCFTTMALFAHTQIMQEDTLAHVYWCGCCLTGAAHADKQSCAAATVSSSRFLR